MSTLPSPSTLLLWRGDGCHLCDETAELLALLLAERARAGLRAPEVEHRRIADDPVAERALFELIPVLELDGVQLPLALRASQIRAWLAARLDVPPATADGSPPTPENPLAAPDLSPAGPDVPPAAPDLSPATPDGRG